MNIEDLKEMFNVDNFIFVSQHCGVVGSLYFRKFEDGKVYRGRIRLVHGHGPQITYREEPEAEWFLVDCSVYRKYYDEYERLKGTEGREEARKKAREKTKGEKKLAVLSVASPDFNLDDAENQIIHEIYTNSHHRSRGKLVRVGRGFPLEGLTNEQIESILWKILDMTNVNESCEESEVEDANEAIIDLTNDQSKNFPAWIKQEAGKYGC
ncbi:MAG: hypothetical protein LBF67_04140 [Prevotellaceae bacterium]|jgi:hypothetical protein|nr:hypothetical protein [Prevotellaceae bacterium]